MYKLDSGLLFYPWSLCRAPYALPTFLARLTCDWLQSPESSARWRDDGAARTSGAKVCFGEERKMATSNNPRKFSEKIALHNQKQAEETAAFEEVMKDLSITRAARVRAEFCLASGRDFFFRAHLPVSCCASSSGHHHGFRSNNTRLIPRPSARFPVRDSRPRASTSCFGNERGENARTRSSCADAEKRVSATKWATDVQHICTATSSMRPRALL